MIIRGRFIPHRTILIAGAIHHLASAVEALATSRLEQADAEKWSEEGRRKRAANNYRRY